MNDNIEDTQQTNEVFKNKKYLTFHNPSYFRFKLAYSLLTMTPIEILNINTTETNLGLESHKISFLKLLSEITNGSYFKINEIGTTLKFIPGSITNNQGEYFKFECHSSRALSYYLEGIFIISLYGKEKLNCSLIGTTNNNTDISADCFKVGIDSIIKKIVVGDESNKIEIVSRSFNNNNEKNNNNTTKGEVKLIFPIIRFVEPFNWTDIGKIKKIGGHCFTKNCSHLSTKIIDKTRIHFNSLLNEVWIGKNTLIEKNGLPGYALSIWGTSTNDFSWSYDKCYFKEIKEENKNYNNSSFMQEEEGHDPEELADEVTQKFLEGIINFGSVDSSFQYLTFALMALAQRNGVSKIRLSHISNYSKGLLKLILELFGVKFKIEKVEIDDYDEDNNEEEEIKEDEESIDDEESDDDNKINDKDLLEQMIPKKYFVFSCVGYQLDNKNRVEG